MRQGLVVLLVAFVAVAFSPAATADLCASFNCPSGNMCAFVDCSACNSGAFCVMCQCHPVPNQVLCTVQSGNCASNCASCKSTSSSQTCWTYVGCGGQGCPSNHCGPGASAPLRELTTRLAAAPCPDCTTQPLAGVTDVLSPAGFPIEVEAVELGIAPRLDVAVGAGVGHYRVKNNSSAGLVMLMTGVTVENDRGEQITLTLVADSWERGEPFARAGGSATLPATTTLHARMGASVRRITVRPIYAEFDDGQRLGPEAEAVHGCVAGERRQLLEKHVRALEAYATGGEAAFDEYLHDAELTWVSVVKAERGMVGALATLKKPRRLAP